MIRHAVFSWFAWVLPWTIAPAPVESAPQQTPAVERPSALPKAPSARKQSPRPKTPASKKASAPHKTPAGKKRVHPAKEKGKDLL